MYFFFREKNLLDYAKTLESISLFCGNGWVDGKGVAKWSPHKECIGSAVGTIQKSREVPD